ncbi:MAG: SEC-C domain-containing protein [Proteobacteria bacterium]|nr:SEC-C domain-containing protein [Pseudomonadota bacterium]
MKRGDRTVHGHVELMEKLGRNDLCPCDSGRRFKALLSEERTLRRRAEKLLRP